MSKPSSIRMSGARRSRPKAHSRSSQGARPRLARRGRPSNVAGESPDTRLRLLEAAADAFIHHGFETTKMEEVALRAGVTTAAIYHHFRSKDDLMLHSARWALETAISRLQECASASEARGRMKYVRAYMSPDFARMRQLIGEIHVAALRHPRLGEMLTAWHRERAYAIVETEAGALSVTGIKAFFMVLLGMCHLDSLSGIKAPSESLLVAMEAAAIAVLGSRDV